MLEKYEGKTWQCMFPCGGDFPELLKFEGNVEYIREVLAKTVTLTKDRECYVDVNSLTNNSNFKKYNKQVCKNASNVPSHMVIETYIKNNGNDYRYQTTEHPIKELQNRAEDNIILAR